MARDTANAAAANSKSAQGLSNTYGAQASANGSILTPTLNKMATSPTGFGQPAIDKMNTAALQTIGGAESGAVGQGNLMAARTNNAGAFAPVAASAAHDATTQLSDAALGVQNRDAMLKEQQRQEGIQGLEGQYNTNVGASENALGLSNSALGAQTAADQQTLGSWLSPLQTISSPFKISKEI
jgi:hypothetical protein